MTTVQELFENLSVPQLDAKSNFLEKFEYHKTIAEFQVLFQKHQSEHIQVCVNEFVEFLSNRWKRIGGTELTYAKATQNPANQYCLVIAKKILPFVTNGANLLSLLAPTVIQAGEQGNLEKNIFSGEMNGAEIQLLADLAEQPENIQTCLKHFNHPVAADFFVAKLSSKTNFQKIKAFFSAPYVAGGDAQRAQIWMRLKLNQRVELMDDLLIPNPGHDLIDILRCIPNLHDRGCFADAASYLSSAIMELKKNDPQLPGEYQLFVDALDKAGKKVSKEMLALLTELACCAVYALKFPKPQQISEPEHRAAMTRASNNIYRGIAIAIQLRNNSDCRKLSGCALTFFAVAALGLAIAGLVLTGGGSVALSTAVSVKAGNIIIGTLFGVGVVGTPIGLWLGCRNQYASLGTNANAFFTDRSNKIDRKTWVAPSADSKASDLNNNTEMEDVPLHTTESDRLLADLNGASGMRMGFGVAGGDSK